jgi:hypothetical protein
MMANPRADIQTRKYGKLLLETRWSRQSPGLNKSQLLRKGPTQNLMMSQTRSRNNRCPGLLPS